MRDRRALNFFLDQTAPLHSDYCAPDFWTKLVPQASWAHPAINHSLVSLASIHESLQPLLGFASEAHDYGIYHYNKAIRSLLFEAPSVEVILLCCLLFAALENLKGTGDRSRVHMKSGMDIIHHLRSSDSTACSTIIKEDIEPSFLLGQAFLSAYGYDNNQISCASTDNGTPMPNMPDMPTPYTPSSANFSNLSVAISLLARLIGRLGPPSDETSQQSGDSVVLEEDGFWLSLRQWETSLQAYSGPDWGSDVRMLKIHHRCVVIHATIYWAATDMVADQLIEDFKWIVAEYGRVLEDGKLQSSPLFHNWLGLIAPLYLVASSCRNPTVRRKAIALLRTLHRNEAAWDSCSAAKLAEEVMLIEERDSTRLRLEAADVVGGKVELTLEDCALPRGSSDSRKESLQWSEREIAIVQWVSHHHIIFRPTLSCH